GGVSACDPKARPFSSPARPTASAAASRWLSRGRARRCWCTAATTSGAKVCSMRYAGSAMKPPRSTPRICRRSPRSGRPPARAIQAHRDRLDVLVNNAGIGSRSGGPQRRTSAEGYELRFAVNYLAGFLLTHQLLPLLMASTPARIVNVASAGQYPLDFDNIMLTSGYDSGRAYMQSKLAQVMFTFDLADELEGSGVTVNCLHPATYMDTTMVREGGVTPLSTVDEGAAAILNLVESRALESCTGLYFERLREARANAQAYDAAARERLRQLSL